MTRLNLEKVPCLRIWVAGGRSSGFHSGQRFVSSSNRYTRALFQVCVQRKRRHQPEKRWDQESNAVTCEFTKIKISRPPITPIRDQWESPGCTDETNCRWKYFGLQIDFDPQWLCSQLNQFSRTDWNSIIECNQLYCMNNWVSVTLEWKIWKRFQKFSCRISVGS